jgi:hypothetical protein
MLDALRFVRGASVVWFVTVVSGFVACDDDDCDGGNCVCASGASCEFACEEPPCHVVCKGDNDECKGTCGNGDCTCGEGSDCDFACKVSPCHVDCAGDNAACSGTCSNGTCRCGPGSHCDFTCADHNCHVECDAGATCTLACPDGSPGTQGCSIDACAAGEATLCADGTLACGVACPT